MQFIDLAWTDKILREVPAFFCRWIYAAISVLYDLFINISKVNILSDDSIKPIYQRVTMILTIVMVFYVTFEIVKYIVQPDGITDKEKGIGNIVYKMIAVVVLIAFVPTIFTGAFKLQNQIVDKNIIGKVILGNNGTLNENFGGQFSASILSMFYSVNANYADEECDGIPCGALVRMNLKSLESESNFFSKLPYMTTGLGSAGPVEKEVEGETIEIQEAYIEFDGLFALCVGGFICYILLLYCIDVGVRWAQLIYLQIIAPIPIIGFLSPKKDGIFQKWCKQCLTTYLDLFIRISLIYFIILICSLLIDPITSGELMVDGVSSTMEIFINIALIMGLLLFGHKAPKMLQELFPKMGAASGNFGLKAGERVAPEAARMAGMALGSTALLRGAIGRGIRAAQRNTNNGHNIFTKRGREAIAESMNKKENATAEYRAARQNLRQARREYNRTSANSQEGAKAKTRFEQAQKDFDKKRNEVADLKNKQYRSIAGSVLAGGAQGAWQGAKSGAKATKLEDISKQVKAGYKKVDDNINAYEKYLNDGGAGGITGAIDRGLTKIETSLGIPTRASTIEQEIKNYDTQIKEQKQLSSVEGSIIKSSDQATDANVKKIEEGKLKQKVVAGTEATLASDLNLSPSEIRSDQTLTDIYQNIKAKADSKRAYADQLSKNAASDPTNTTLRIQAEKAQKEAVQEEQNVKKATKKMGEYTNTIILRDKHRDSNTDYEAGAVIAINTALQRLKDASAQPSTMERLSEHLSSQPSDSLPDGTTVSELIEYVNNPDSIEEFGILDYLGKALSRVSATRESKTQEIENAKNRVASGAYKAEVTSNVEYNNSGNSGK